MSKPSTEVAVLAGLPVVQGDRPDYLPAVIPGAQARGSEDVGVKDLVIPRLDIVQALSPYRKRGDAKYIEGAVEGDLVNSLTLVNYGTAVVVVPVIFKKDFLVWKSRKDQNGKPTTGGFFGAFPTLAEAEDRAHEARKEDLNAIIEVIDTPMNFCYIVTPDGAVQEIVVSMARSKAKVSRKWNSLVRLNEGDRFSRAYKLSTLQEKGKSGDDYYNFDVAAVGYPSKEVYLRAEKMYKDITGGSLKVTAHADDDEEATVDSTPSEF